VVQENLIRNKMKAMYKKGGKKPSKKKSSFMEESKEITFGNKPMMKGYGGMKYKAGGAVPECGPGKFWDGSKCVDSKTNKLPETSWPDDLVNELIPTYDKKTGKREYAYSEGIFDAEGRARTVDYDEVKKQERERKKKKTGGAKSMEPGGGGRFAKMVSGLKKKGKSEESAKAIAASIGRKKYGKSRFQEMAAAGKKKMGGKKC
jgi:hypothetical protein